MRDVDAAPQLDEAEVVVPAEIREAHAIDHGLGPRTALAPETRARAIAVAGTIRTDGATVAAKLLLDAVIQECPPASA